MTEFLLQLLGARADEVVRVADSSVALRGGWSVGWIVFLIVLMAAGIYWLYRNSPATLSPARKHILTALRILFLGLILCLFLRPVLSLTVEGSVRRMLVMLMDSSASMQIQDPRLQTEDRIRAGIALGDLDARGGLKQNLSGSLIPKVEQVSRLKLVQEAWQNEKLNLLPRLDREFDLSAFSFGQGVAELSARPVQTNDQAVPKPGASRNPTPFAWVNDLQAQSPVTAVGDALRDVMNRKRGQPLAGILLVTDGANNSGTSPLEIATLLRQENIPLFVHGVGITSPRDIIVGSLFAPDVSFVKDEVSVTVRIRAQGLAGQEATLNLSLNSDVVATQSITFAEDGEQVVPLHFTPQTEGEFDLTASIDPRPDEAVKDNNMRTQRLRVVDQKIKVLLVDQSPRWEFRYLQAMLMRDRRVVVSSLLIEADPKIARAKDSPYLDAFPSRREELFQYDLVIFGDVDPKAVSNAQLDNLSELVSRFGGALVMIAGKRFAPQAYRRGLMDKMLPVEYDAVTLDSTKDVSAEKPITLELTAAGKNSPMLRLSDKPEENVALWKELPPVYWVSKVARPKPAAEVLLVDPDPSKESRFGKMPVIAVQQYGLGQVMFVGTDNTWRWRKNVGDLYYTALWGQIAQRVSLPRLLGVSKLTQLTSDRQNYLTGDRVTVFARLYSAGYEPMKQPSVKGFFGLKSGLGPRPEVILRPIPEQPGLYRGEFVAPAAGSYQFLVEHDPNAPMDFSVTEPRFEFGATAMNEPLLRELSAATGGAFFREEDLYLLPETISNQSERVRSPLEVELWCSPIYFLLLLGVASAEWLLRKWSHLK